MSIQTLQRKRAARKPSGGFVFTSPARLIAAWKAYRENRIRLQDLRVWLAAHEQEARRCQCPKGTKPDFDLEELRRLTGAATRSAVACSLRRLTTERLIRWGSSKISFPRPDLGLLGLNPEETVSFGSLHRLVPMPRRMLRLLAGGARRVLIATVFGHAIRCLYYRKGQCNPVGGCKASWIASAFSVDLRAVKRARAHLFELGWLERLSAPQWRLNRMGAILAVNLNWERAQESKSQETKSRYTGTPGRGGTEPKRPPPRPKNEPKLPPPDSNKKLSSRSKNQKPASRGGAGVSKPKSKKTPTLRDIRPEDLKSTERLLQLFNEACSRGLLQPSEHDRLRFVAAAEHAKAIGSTNPCGLLAYLVRRGRWHYVTQDDEDAANKRLKAHFYGSVGERDSKYVPRETQCEEPELSDDGYLVRAIVAVAKRNRISMEPFYLLKQKKPEWTKERWDEALEEAKLFDSMERLGRLRRVSERFYNGQ